MGNGKSIKFWFDNWMAQDNLVTLLAKNFDLVEESLMVSDFILSSK